MPKMRFIKAQRYNKQNYAPGDVADIKQIHVKVFKAAGIAEPINAQATKDTAAQKKTAAAKPAAKAAAAKGPARKKTAVSASGTYDRRDMKAK